MAIKLLTSVYGKTVGTIISDVSYALEQRLVSAALASYDLSGGTHAASATIPAELTDDERDTYLISPLSAPVFSGVYDYNDLGTATVALVVPNTGAWVDVPNDGGGAFTNKTYALPGVADIWDAGNGVFDFSGLQLGDTVDIRLDLTVTTSSPNAEIGVDLFIANGEAGQYQIEFASPIFKAVGTHPVVVFSGIYMGDDNTRLNDALFKIKSDDTLAVKVNGWYVRVTSRKGVLN